MNRKTLSEKIRKTADFSKIDIVGFANASEFVASNSGKAWNLGRLMMVNSGSNVS